jgi:SAM-dependent methyltransferase
MFTIYGEQQRLDYWRDFWATVDRDVDDISSTSVYPLYPTDKYVKPGQKVLEAGVGMGRVMKHYHKRGVTIVGMDYEPECIKRLSQQDASLQLYVGDVNDLPEPDATYDVIVAFGTLSNLPDPRKALKEFNRVLKPGGIVVASVTNDNLMRRLLVGLSRLKSSARHFSMVAYRPAEWRAFLGEAGFEIREITPIVTRLPLFQYFPFLRSSRNPSLEWTNARDGDKGLALNSVGEWVFKTAFRYIPFSISHGVVGVAQKPQ